MMGVFLKWFLYVFENILLFYVVYIIYDYRIHTVTVLNYSSPPRFPHMYLL